VSSRPRHGLWSGVGVNIGVMIGTGVFVSAGFMAETMGPGAILLAWVVGGLLAMSGARAYAEVATRVPRSGGEYRFLTDLFHPWAGTLAGWTSLIAGFSAPVASSAATAGFFAATIFPGLDPTLVAVVIIGGNTLVHAFHHGVSKWTQDALAVAKVLLIAGFIVAGLTLGSTAWPDFTPLRLPDDRVANFMAQLVFVMYAYTGWNSAVYAAEEYRDPARTVPRSMVIAAAAVMVIYVAVNWVLVANLTTVTARAFLAADTGKVTLGHLVTQDLLGPAGARVMSILVVLILVSSVSSMTVVGPRVYQVMARDGFMPRALAGTDDRPPLLSVLLQGALSLAIFFTHTLAELIGNITVLLTMTSALTAASLFKLRPRPAPLAMAAAVVYVAGSVWMLYAIFSSAPRTMLWPAIIVVVSTVAYFALRPSRARL
jgi:basic amino acid/polyamine antiporter, APA family